MKTPNLNAKPQRKIATQKNQRKSSKIAQNSNAK